MQPMRGPARSARPVACWWQCMNVLTSTPHEQISAMASAAAQVEDCSNSCAACGFRGSGMRQAVRRSLRLRKFRYTSREPVLAHP